MADACAATRARHAAARTTNTQAALPESPRWLLLSGAGRDAALRALVRAEGRRARANMAAVAAEVDGMAASLAASSGSGGDGASGAAGAAAAAGTAGSSVLSALGLSLFREQRYVRPLLVGMSLMLFQQVRLCCVLRAACCVLRAVCCVTCVLCSSCSAAQDSRHACTLPPRQPS
jgi:hypothetical protein